MRSKCLHLSAFSRGTEIISRRVCCEELARVIRKGACSQDLQDGSARWILRPVVWLLLRGQQYCAQREPVTQVKAKGINNWCPVQRQQEGVVLSYWGKDSLLLHLHCEPVRQGLSLLSLPVGTFIPEHSQTALGKCFIDYLDSHGPIRLTQN